MMGVGPPLPLLTPVLDHVNMLLQYTTSSACSIPFAKFTSLVGHRPDPVPDQAPALVLMPRDHWPVDEAVDPWIQVARSETLRSVEVYLDQHLSQVLLTGKAYPAHEVNLIQLTDHIAEACLDAGLFSSAILVQDNLFPFRESQLKAALIRTLGLRRPNWNQRSLQRQVSLASIASLSQVSRLSPHVTTLILDLAHLWGSVDHYAWLKYVCGQASDRSMSIVALGWQGVPPVRPGWSLNSQPASHDHVEDMLLDGPWKRNPAWTACFRTKEELLRLSRSLLLQQRGLVVLVRGVSDSMEGRRCQRFTRSLGRMALTVGLFDLPMFILREKTTLRPTVQCLLVLQESIADKLSLEQWMLLLSHMDDSVLILYKDQEQGLASPPSNPVQTILAWTRGKTLGRITLTRPIFKPSPWD